MHRVASRVACVIADILLVLAFAKPLFRSDILKLSNKAVAIHDKHVHGYLFVVVTPVSTGLAFLVDSMHCFLLTVHEDVYCMLKKLFHACQQQFMQGNNDPRGKALQYEHHNRFGQN